MTTRTAAFALAFALASTSALAQTAEKKTGSKSTMSKTAMSETLMTNEKAMLDSLTKHDATGFFAVVGPGAWSVDQSGAVSMDQFRKDWAQIKVESFSTSDMKVVPIDATSGIVTYKLDQKGTYAGQPFPPTVYATTVWVNRSGKWLAVFHQESTPAATK